MTNFFQLSVQGLALGGRYALVALGFVVIYKATRVINFSQGGMVTLGAYLAYTAHEGLGLAFPFAAVVAVGITALGAAIIERLLMRRMMGQPSFAALMITVGLLLVIEQVVTTLWGFDARNLGDPWGIRTTALTGVVVAIRDLWTIGLVVVVLAAFSIFFRYSRSGLALRATALDQEAALAQGVDVRGMFALSWALAGGLAALAGVMLASGASNLNPSLGLIALAAFPAAIVGGLDSPAGAALGALVIGLTETLTAGYQPRYAPWLGQNFHAVMPYVVMVIILLIRPYGMLGTAEVRRA